MEYTPKRFHCPACGFEPAENVSEKNMPTARDALPPSMKRTARATNAAASYSPFPFG